MTEESKDYIELNTRILGKNLEITKLTQQVDKLRSDNVNLNCKVDEMSDEIVRLSLIVEQKNKDIYTYL